MDLLFEAALFVGPRARRFDQFLEQVAVVDHGHAQVLGAGVTAGVAHRHLVGDAVVGDQLGVVDRQVRRALLEVADRIAALLHHLIDERIGGARSAPRVVDESRLDRAPAALVVHPLRRAEWTDVELLDTLLSFDELGFRLARAAHLPHRTIVLRSVLLTQRVTPPALPHQQAHRREYHHGGDDENDHRTLGHGSPPDPPAHRCARRGATRRGMMGATFVARRRYARNG